MSRKLLHVHAVFNSVQLIYVCRFISADLEKPGAGRVLWRCADYAEAMTLWNQTIGEPYDQGKFTLSAEAVYEETASVPRPRKPDNQLDLFDEAGKGDGVSAGVPTSPADGPEAEGQGTPLIFDQRGDAGVDRVDHGASP